MKTFNATVIGGFTGRDSIVRLWVQPDDRKLESRLIHHDAPLDEGKRVRLDGGVIVEVQ